MPYRIVDLEVTQPIPDIHLTNDEDGLALVLRRYDRPIAFAMHRLQPGTALARHELLTLVERVAGPQALQEALREELVPLRHLAHVPSLTVAICTRDHPEILSRCLNSLRALRGPVDRLRFETLVIDNAPSDARTEELVDGLPGVRYAREPRPGLDFARNRALQEATGELIAYLDDDVLVDRGWLEGLAEAWADNPDAAAFTGLVLPYELATEAQVTFERRGGFRRGFERLRYAGQELTGNTLYPCGAGIFGAGCNMAFRRQALLDLGGFDEALDTGAPLPGGGDLDVFYRVIRAGLPLVYEPRFLVFHQHRRQHRELRRQYWTWGTGFMAFVTKSYRSDPARRRRFRGLVIWWFQDQARRLFRSLIGRHPLSPDLVMAELTGGLVGLLGEYPRSQRRVERIRRMATGE